MNCRRCSKYFENEDPMLLDTEFCSVKCEQKYDRVVKSLISSMSKFQLKNAHEIDILLTLKSERGEKGK